MNVVDANVALQWSIKTPLSQKAASLLRKDRRVIAPDVIIAEITNAWVMQVRLGNQDAELARDSLEQLPRWFFELVPSMELRVQAFDLALKLNHPTYDCFYLALALSRSVRLVTADARFRRKTEAAGYGKTVVALEEWEEG